MSSQANRHKVDRVNTAADAVENCVLQGGVCVINLDRYDQARGVNGNSPVSSEPRCGCLLRRVGSLMFGWNWRSGPPRMSKISLVRLQKSAQLFWVRACSANYQASVVVIARGILV